MILILIALIAVTTLGIFGAKYKSSCWDASFLGGFVCPIISIVGFLGLLIYTALLYDYIAAGYKVAIINSEYNTNYTQEDVFYASSVINTIRELDRKRIEVNGDLVTGK